MKKISFRSISVLITLAVVFSCAFFPANAASVNRTFTLTVLGDSVAAGSYVENEYRYGDVLKDMLTQNGYDVTYQNYAVVKNGARSIFDDFSEETFSFDNSAYVGLYGAPDYRQGVTFESYTNQLKNSDAILINVGKDDVLAKFYAMRGYNNYYKFYYSENDKLIFENDINNGNVDWIYTWNDQKARDFEARFEDGFNFYMEENIKSLLSLNPNAKIVINNILNPYAPVLEKINAYNESADRLKNILDQLDDSTTIFQVIARGVQLHLALQEYISAGEAAFKATYGTTTYSCDGLDISGLRATQRILYKYQYARMQMCASNMYEIANEVIENLCEKYGCVMTDIVSTDVRNNLTGETPHPDVLGHKIIAETIYEILDR